MPYRASIAAATPCAAPPVSTSTPEKKGLRAHLATRAPLQPVDEPPLRGPPVVLVHLLLGRRRAASVAVAVEPKVWVAPLGLLLRIRLGLSGGGGLLSSGGLERLGLAGAGVPPRVARRLLLLSGGVW